MVCSRVVSGFDLHSRILFFLSLYLPLFSLNSCDESERGENILNEDDEGVCVLGTFGSQKYLPCTSVLPAHIMTCVV